MAGAAAVTAVDVDPYAVAAITLNAAANGVVIAARAGDPMADDLPQADLVVAGDVFYEPELAAQVMNFLGRCRDAGIDALVGDVGRAALPRHLLRLLMEYQVPDVGDGASAQKHAGGVFALA
jgi:predicted nicotinamide N-methyase